jgi:hypothetical protein
MEILCDAGNIEVKINDQLVVKGDKASPNSGRILLQSHSGEIFFRRFELDPIK